MSDDSDNYYIVQRGDTLSKIAHTVYGDANLYMVIFDANSDVLDDPDHIEIGQELYIPNLDEDEDEDYDEDYDEE